MIHNYKKFCKVQGSQLHNCLHTANTGGLLGLFMGFSFLSLVEIMYFATLRFWCRIYKKRHVSRDNTLHVQPFDSNTNLVYPFVQ